MGLTTPHPPLPLYLDARHGDCGGSRLRHEAVRGPPFHEVPCVGHVPPSVGPKHKVLSECVHQHDDHPLEQRVREAR